MEEGQIQKSNAGLIVGIVVLAVLIFGALTWALIKAPSGGPSKERVSFSDGSDMSRGPDNAKVVVHVYSDFQCPACKFADGPLQQTMEKYQDRVKFVWKDFPLESIHPLARSASIAARCANDQGWFWKFNKTLYERQDAWTKATDLAKTFNDYAAEIGMDTGRFTACFVNKGHDDQVQANINEGNANNVDRTPTFFVNNQRYFGMGPEEWSRVLDEALAKAK